MPILLACHYLFCVKRRYVNLIYIYPWKGRFKNLLFWRMFCATVRWVIYHDFPWWRHQMETFSAALAICPGNSPIPGEFPTQRPVTRRFDVFFDLRLNKRLRKQSWGWWFETLSRPLWRQCNVYNEILGSSISWWITYLALCHKEAYVAADFYHSKTFIPFFGTLHVLLMPYGLISCQTNVHILSPEKYTEVMCDTHETIFLI